MGGGIGVVCGCGREDLPSVIGDRSCVGMVGGTIYVRGPVVGLSDEVWLLSLDDADRDFLKQNMPVFLGKIGRPELEEELTDFSRWQKIVAKTYEERNVRSRMTLREFRDQKWVADGGIFADVVKDDYAHVAGLVNAGEDRIKIPHWQDKRFGAPCQVACPSNIPTQDRINLLRQGKYEEALEHLRFVGLEHRAFDLSGALAYGEQRRLELARALASHPRLLLLDEPAAGMNPLESAQLMQLIRKIRDRGITVLIIEHDMKVMMNLADHIYAFDHGELIAQGTPNEIRANPRVIEAYLGRGMADAQA